MSENFPDPLESFQLVCKLYILSEIFFLSPDCLETFQIKCRLSQLSGKFTDYLESLLDVCKRSKFYVSRMSDKFFDFPDSSFIFQKVLALCGMFLYHLESVPSFRKVQRVKRQSEKCFKHGLFPKMN